MSPSRNSSHISAARAPVELGAEGDRLGLVDGHVGNGSAAGDHPGQQLSDDRLRRPSAKVLAGLLDRDTLGSLGGDSADAAERIVRRRRVLRPIARAHSACARRRASPLSGMSC